MNVVDDGNVNYVKEYLAVWQTLHDLPDPPPLFGLQVKDLKAGNAIALLTTVMVKSPEIHLAAAFGNIEVVYTVGADVNGVLTNIARTRLMFGVQDCTVQQLTPIKPYLHNKLQQNIVEGIGGYLAKAFVASTRPAGLASIQAAMTNLTATLLTKTEEKPHVDEARHDREADFPAVVLALMETRKKDSVQAQATALLERFQILKKDDNAL